jgi:DNA-binding XRE family transcriptional regulator
MILLLLAIILLMPFDRHELKRLRVATGKKPELIALELGITKEAYVAYETGRAVPPTNRILALCDLFDCSAADLLRPEHSIAAVAARSRTRSRKAQGLPAKVTDPAALDDAARLLRRQA